MSRRTGAAAAGNGRPQREVTALPRRELTDLEKWESAGLPKWLRPLDLNLPHGWSIGPPLNQNSIEEIFKYLEIDARLWRRAQGRHDEFTAAAKGIEADLAFGLGHDIGVIEGRSSVLAEIQALLREQINRQAAVARRNRGKEITDVERAEAKRLDAELAEEYPTKTPRYREIAKRMSIKYDRVRSLIEGPRKGNPKNRGKRKQQQKQRMHRTVRAD